LESMFFCHVVLSCKGVDFVQEVPHFRWLDKAGFVASVSHVFNRFVKSRATHFLTPFLTLVKLASVGAAWRSGVRRPLKLQVVQRDEAKVRRARVLEATHPITFLSKTADSGVLDTAQVPLFDSVEVSGHRVQVESLGSLEFGQVLVIEDYLWVQWLKVLCILRLIERVGEVVLVEGVRRN